MLNHYLLNEAYVRARYDRSYKITKQQLEYRDQQVKILRDLIKKVCGEKIESLV